MEPPRTDGVGGVGCPPCTRDGDGSVFLPFSSPCKKETVAAQGGGSRGAQHVGAMGRVAGATRGSRRCGSPSRHRWWGCGMSAPCFLWHPAPHPIGRRRRVSGSSGGCGEKKGLGAEPLVLTHRGCVVSLGCL